MKKAAINRKLSKSGPDKDSKPSRDFSFSKANQEGRRKSALPIIIILGAVIVFLMIGAVVASKTDRYAWMRSSTPQTLPGRPVSSNDKWRDLNGMSMGEWMKKNNVNSQMMKERQQRLQQHKSGQQM
jgi:hypothetical protein